jgi:type VI protein secretion system component VasF
MVMSNTPTQRKPPAGLNRVLSAHQRRARIIAQLHAQAIATANVAQREAIRASTAKDAVHGKAEGRLCTGAFILALGGVVALGYALAAMVRWQ